MHTDSGVVNLILNETHKFYKEVVRLSSHFCNLTLYNIYTPVVDYAVKRTIIFKLTVSIYLFKKKLKYWKSLLDYKGRKQYISNSSESNFVVGYRVHVRLLLYKSVRKRELCRCD